MSRRLASLVVAAAAAVSLAACAGATQSGCSQPPVVQYPPLALVSPANGATNVALNVGTLVVSSAATKLYGQLTVTGPQGTWNLSPQSVPGGSGSTNNYSAHLPLLQAGANYTVRYTLTYPGGCQGPDIQNTQTVGHFST